MKKINLKDIDFSNLQKLKTQGTKSIIYTDGDICYKFLEGLYPNEKKDLYKKFLEMDGINIANVLFPKDLIIEDDTLKGYTMQYIKDAMPLSDKFFKRYFNCKDLFTYVEKASGILREIHNNGITCQDLSFENILIDNNGNTFFCDIDSCAYKNHYGPFFSLLFKEFLFDYRNTTLSSIEDVDKVSMILSFYLTIYGTVLQKITKRQYHILSDHINTLENLRNFANMLVDKNAPIQDVPYLDEVIDVTDNYEIDREKLLTLKQKILRRF